MALTWDEAWERVQESFLGPIRSIINTIFGVVFTAIDLLQAALTLAGLGGGILEENLQELRDRVEVERDGADEEIGGVVGEGVKFALVEMFSAAGVELDPDEPFSEESISGAVSQLLGYPFQNVFNEELLRKDIEAIVVDIFQAQTGYNLDGDDPFGAASITGLASQFLNFQFQNVLDAELLLEDLQLLADKTIEEVVGVPIELADQESIGNFAAAILVQAVEGQLTKLDVSAICPAVNTVAQVLCKVQNCHPCMDDEEDCIKRREAQKANRSKYQKKCTRVKG